MWTRLEDIYAYIGGYILLMWTWLEDIYAYIGGYILLKWTQLEIEALMKMKRLVTYDVWIYS